MTLTYYEQDTHYTCGSACVRMILSTINIEESEENLVKELKTNDKIGTKAISIFNYLSKKGFKVRIENKASLDNIVKLHNEGYYIIVKTRVDNIGHYVIFKETRDGGVFVYDPALGPNKMVSKGKFEKLRTFKWLGLTFDKEIIAVKGEKK